MSNDIRAQFYTALAKAQGAIEGAKKDTKNTFFKSKYADLSAVWDACREQLSKNGISVMQFPDYDPETKIVSVETILAHSGGFEKSFKTRVPTEKTTAQAVGSATTYGRRYAPMAAIGIAPEDDDAESSMGRGEFRKEAESKAEEWGDKRGDDLHRAMEKPKPSTMAQFQAHITTLARDDGAIAVQKYWDREDVQAFWAKKPEEAREDAQAYVEDTIEEIIKGASGGPK